MAGIFYYDVVLNRLKINFKLSSIQKSIMFIILLYFLFSLTSLSRLFHS